MEPAGVGSESYAVKLTVEVIRREKSVFKYDDNTLRLERELLIDNHKNVKLHLKGPFWLQLTKTRSGDVRIDIKALQTVNIM
uniref:Uncharacterized protein n=1 Tax=Romanomermis culicivorax TaxID=13658 RepID=A0A915J8C3_ROMCU